MASRHAAPPDNIDRCTDTRGAGQILGLSAQTLNQWRVQGKGPAFYRFGRQVRYRISELNEYMAARKVGG